MYILKKVANLMIVIRMMKEILEELQTPILIDNIVMSTLEGSDDGTLQENNMNEDVVESTTLKTITRICNSSKR